MCIKTHSVDSGKRGTERGIHTVPHTRWTAGPADHGGDVGTGEGLGGASESIWPGEEACGLCITPPSCCTCV